MRPPWPTPRASSSRVVTMRAAHRRSTSPITSTACSPASRAPTIAWSPIRMSTSGARSTATRARVVTAMLRSIAAACTLLLGIVMGGTPAGAAPQILGLMASNTPVPLTCTGEACTAIAGTFCLQHDRDIPTYGTPYGATHPEQLTLAVMTPSGDVLRLPGGDWLRFSGYDGYTTVRL